MTGERKRLSKLMSERGICSRREADTWIAAGLVRVDGEVVSTLGTRVDPHCRISLDDEALDHQRGLVTILLNKPVGYVSGQPEDGYPAASSLITRSNRLSNDRSGVKFCTGHRRGLAPAGRLDIDSQGLLVLTQDGRVAKLLIGPDSGVEKEYRVGVDTEPGKKALGLLTHGLTLDDVALKPARVRKVGPRLLNIVLTEGRKRQIRRMCELVGLKVTSLQRVRIGRVRLSGLPKGKWRYLRQDEAFD